MLIKGFNFLKLLLYAYASVYFYVKVQNTRKKTDERAMLLSCVLEEFELKAFKLNRGYNVHQAINTGQMLCERPGFLLLLYRMRNTSQLTTLSAWYVREIELHPTAFEFILPAYSTLMALILMDSKTFKELSKSEFCNN
jgi:hypothetical protein